jgi:hypothetical protein
MNERRYAATTFTLWLLAAILAAGWIEERKDEPFNLLNFALATFAMAWAVGVVVLAVTGVVTVVLGDRR